MSDDPPRARTHSLVGPMALAHRLFPHREFRLRSRGDLRFFEFTPPFQMTVAMGTVLLLLWISYASIVTIFKDQIIVAKDRRYAKMRAVYEEQVSQVRVLSQALFDECQRTTGCNVNKIIAESRDPTSALAGLRFIDSSAADRAGKIDTPYRPNAAYDTLATTWEVMKSLLEDLLWITTRGKEREVSDETTLQFFVAAVWGSLSLVAVLLWRIVVRTVTRTAQPNANAAQNVLSGDSAVSLYGDDAGDSAVSSSTKRRRKGFVQ